MSRPRAQVLAAGLLTLIAAVFAPALSGRQGIPPPPPPPPPPILSIPQDAGAPGQQPAPAKGDAIILGQVVDSATGRPIASASVTLSGRPADPAAPAGRAGGPAAAIDPNRAFTNSDGHFVFRALPKGSFGLTAIASGYQLGNYGQGRAGGPSRSLEIDDSAAVVTVTIKLWKYASITGTVTDEAGEPAVGVRVQSLRRVTTNGKPRLQTGFTATTDDRGMYRIPQLTTGDYLVVVPTTLVNIPTSTVDTYVQAAQSGTTADLTREYSASNMPFPSPTGLRVGDQQLQFGGGRGGGSSLPATLDGPIQTYVTVYHPSAIVAAQANVITLAPGDERQGADIQLRLVRTVRVSGTVTGPDGPAANMGVRLVPVEALDTMDSGYETAITATDGKGQFTFLGVPAGQYVVKVQRTPRPAGAPMVLSMVNGVATNVLMPTSTPGAPPSEPMLWAQQALTVGDSDLSGVNIGLRTGARISGHIEFEGTSTPRPAAERIALTVYASPVDSVQTMIMSSRPDSNLQFTTGPYSPGRYLMVVGAGGSFPQWTLKSATTAGRDALVQPIELGSTDINDVVITYTDQIADLSGTVRDGGQPVVDATVFVFPAEYQTWIANGMASRLSKTVAPGKTGAFTIRDIPAGAYLAVALPSSTAVDLTDPQWIAKLAVLGTRVSIGLGEKKQQDLTVSRIR